jgi:hypothetical protein
MLIPSRERHLGTLGYRSVAVDLYEGKSATRHNEGVKRMQSLDRKATDKILQAGLDVMVYGFGFDKVDTKTLERLQSPVPVIAGGEDTGATQAAVTFSPPLEKQRNGRAKYSFIRVRTTVTRNHSSELQPRSRPHHLRPGPGFSCHSFGA